MMHCLFVLPPQVVLDPILEHLKDLQQSVPELACAQRSIANAYALYIKTRPPASSESSKRAKTMSQGGIHPLLLQSLPKTRYTDLKVRQPARCSLLSPP